MASVLSRLLDPSPQSGANVVPVRPSKHAQRAGSALTASAEKASARSSSESSRVSQPWQVDALGYYDQIGAVRYASQFLGRAFSKIRWYVGERDENGEVKESENEAAQSLWERVQDPGGGRSVMLSTYAQLMFLTGEVFLLWSQPDGLPEQWEMVSVLELRRGSDKQGKATYTRIPGPNVKKQDLVEAADDDYEPLGDEVRVYRLWHRHPAYSALADAPMHSVLAECEEIVRATQTINARLISRLSGPGIFAIPESWSGPPPQDVVGDENPNEDPFMVELTGGMTAGISNPGSPDSVVPIVIRVPDGQTAEGHLYKFWPENEVIRELELREKALRRFAIGVDMPPEMVTGLGETNHWNAWAIDKEAWEHIDPHAQEFADALGGAYLRPAAEAAGIPNWKNLVIAYDPSGILTNPDSFADAKIMHDSMVVGDSYLRDAGNATDDDKPTDEELQRMLLVKLAQAVEIVGGKIVMPEPPADEPPTGEETPEEQPPEPVPVEEDGLNAAAYRIIGAAELAMERSREIAGAKLRAFVQGNCLECVQTIQGVPVAQIPSTLGPGVLTELGALDAYGLVEGSAAGFVSTVARWGITETQAKSLAEVLENHAARTLYDEQSPQLPPGFLGRVRTLASA